MVDPATGLPSLDIWVVQRPSLDAPWGTPQNLGPTVNSPQVDQCVHLAPDGYTLMFASTRPGGLGTTGNDIYVSHRRNPRDDFGWDAPENLGSGVNSSFNEVTPASFEDDNGNFTLYFSSDRLIPGLRHIFASVMGNDGTFSPAVPDPELSSSSGDDLFPTPRRDGLELFLSSTRPGSLGGTDLWVSTRPSITAPWSTPINMGPSVNSTANDQGGALSYNGTNLIFYSTRPGGSGGNDLYSITRAKVPGPTVPAISAGGVVNAATYAAGPLAPNSTISIFGSDLATVSASGQLPGGGFSTNLFGTRVSFAFSGGSADAPLIYISSRQINALVPASVPAGSARVTVTVYGAISAPQPVTIAAPGSR